MIRNIAGGIAGLLAAGIVIMAVEIAGMKLFPLPPELRAIFEDGYVTNTCLADIQRTDEHGYGLPREKLTLTYSPKRNNDNDIAVIHHTVTNFMIFHVLVPLCPFFQAF